MRTRRFLLKLSLMLVVALALIGLSALSVEPVAAQGGDPEATGIDPAYPEAVPGPACGRPTATSAFCPVYARVTSLTMPDATVVPAWGFSLYSTTSVRVPGPTLVVNQGDTVQVRLFNQIPGETMSLTFPGFEIVPDSVGVATGAARTYTFVAGSPGTYRYEAGPTPNGARQVLMGLSGTIIVRPAGSPTWAYDASTAFDDEFVLMFTEVDPAFSADPNGFVLHSLKPQYRLINGRAYPQTVALPVTPGDRILLRYHNVSADNNYVAVLGLDQDIIAIDGNQLTYSYTIVSEAMGAGQTLDAMVTIPADASEGARYAVYDASRLLHNGGALAANGTVDLGGILTFLVVSGGQAPTDTGPIASSVTVSPTITAGTAEVTLAAHLDDTPTLSAENVVQWEYFVNDLGAPGTGVSMTVPAPATTVDVTAAVPTSTLSLLPPGDVTIYVHGQDASGDWGPVSSTVLDLIIAGPVIRGLSLSPDHTNGSVDVILRGTADDTAMGQIDVVDAEYFIGTPGVDGTGSPMSLNRQAPIVALEASIPAATVAALAEGNQAIYVHALDDLGNWGGFGIIDLIVDKSGPSSFGQSLLPNPNNGFLPINASSYAVRMRVIVADALSTLVEAEGFIDTPGADGDGFPLVSKDGLYNMTVEEAYVDIPLPTIRALSEGVHTFHFHGLDAAGNWGAFGTLNLTVDKTGPAASSLLITPNPTAGQSFVQLFASVADTTSDLTAAEWYEGFDPGAGQGIPMTASDGLFDSPAETAEAVINVSGWANGNHTISVRGKDVAGNWGPAQTIVLDVTGNVGGGILADNFETGNLVGWDLRQGAVDVTPEAALQGANGLRAALSGTAPAYVVDRRPSRELGYTASFLFDANGIDTAGSAIDLLVGRNYLGTEIFGLQYEQDEVRAWVLTAAGPRYTNWTHIANGERIGLDWRSGSAASFKLLIGDAAVETLNGLDTHTYQLEEVRLGPSGGLAEGASGVAYLDSFVSIRTILYRTFVPLAVSR